MRLSEAPGNAGCSVDYQIKQSHDASSGSCGACGSCTLPQSDAASSKSKRFNGDVDAHHEVMDSARAEVLTELTPERLRATYRSAFAPAQARYTAVALLPKRTLLQRALAAHTAASAAWADAGPAARGSAMLVAGAAGALAAAVVYARWRAWRRS
jgi:hypothetical protein